MIEREFTPQDRIKIGEGIRRRNLSSLENATILTNLYRQAVRHGIYRHGDAGVNSAAALPRWWQVWRWVDFIKALIPILQMVKELIERLLEEVEKPEEHGAD